VSPSALRVLVYSAQLEAVGGIESHVREFCLAMAAAGQKLTLLSSRSCMDSSTRNRLARAGIELVLNEGRWFSASPARKWIWTMGALMRLSLRKFDVVYTNGQGLNPASVLRWFRGRARLIHHHHTSCDPGEIAKWPVAYREAMLRSDELVVVADFIRQRMQAATGRKDVQVAYCFTRNVSPSLPARSPNAAVVFGYFGRLIEGKGIDWMQRLSRDPRLAGVRWKIWGGEAHFRARDFEPYPNISYEGTFRDEAGLRAALDAMDCFVLLSATEGLPLSLMETMAAGKPWIATPEGGIPELAHDPASCVLVNLNDYENVVEACLAMQARILAEQIDHTRQRAFYDARLGDRALLARWLAVLHGRAEASEISVESTSCEGAQRRAVPSTTSGTAL
jgi:glycosyltransferase involved in cell wall biosynthesis